MGKSAKLTIRKWGNSLAVRIPSAVAKSAQFALGQTVEVRAENSSVVVTPIQDTQLTLSEKLKLFDPQKHGGEAMASGRVGAEVM